MVEVTACSGILLCLDEWPELLLEIGALCLYLDHLFLQGK